VAHVHNTLVWGLHYVLICVNYNEMLFMLYLLKLVQQHSYLSCESHRMAGLHDYNILQPRHLVRSRLRGMHDSVSVQNLSISLLCMLT
jgi:hypothetical protein